MATHQGDMMTQTFTGETDVTSSSSRGAAFYFECFVLVIGVIGTAANGLILYALVASKQHKKHELIVNQNLLDLYSCLFLIITYGLKLCNMDLSESLGYWLCKLVLNENLLWCGVYGSFINLTLIAIERYLKVVYSIWSKKHLRRWMTHAAAAFAWIGSFVHMMVVGFESSAIINGACFGFVIWESPEAGMAYGIFYFISAYVIVLLIFIFCYGKILLVVRRQAHLMASYSASQMKSNLIQLNVFKTMALVCAFYAVAWLPENIYFLLMSLHLNLSLLDRGYYVALFVAFIYICATVSYIANTRFARICVSGTELRDQNNFSIYAPIPLSMLRSLIRSDAS